MFVGISLVFLRRTPRGNFIPIETTLHLGHHSRVSGETSHLPRKVAKATGGTMISVIVKTRSPVSIPPSTSLVHRPGTNRYYSISESSSPTNKIFLRFQGPRLDTDRPFLLLCT